MMTTSIPAPQDSDPFFALPEERTWNACIGPQGDEENYIDGYVEAALELASAVLERQLFASRDTLVLPILYNARHGIELSLKFALKCLFAAEVVKEGSSALWDTVLRDHRECALREPYGYYPHYYNLDFTCPVAAAGRAVFGQMALDGAMRGAWSHQSVVQTAYVTLPARGAVSLEVRKALLRELPRAWLADSLMLFGEASRVGRTSARWEPHPAAFQGKTMVKPWSKGAEFVTKRPASWLAATAAFSAEKCPNRKALPGTGDLLKLLLA